MPRHSTKVLRICEYCGKHFFVWPAIVKRGGGRFCSHRCPPATMADRACEYCGKPFLAKPCIANRGGAKFCSRSCTNASKITPLADRFWAKVNKDGPIPAHMPHLGPCWLWTGPPTRRRGIGQIKGNDGRAILPRGDNRAANKADARSSPPTLFARSVPNWLREPPLLHWRISTACLFQPSGISTPAEYGNTSRASARPSFQPRPRPLVDRPRRQARRSLRLP